MSNPEQNQDSDFMIEKIKDRPVNRKKLIRRTLITASMAVIFGLIACLTFLILEPVFNHWLYPEEGPKPVEFPEETEEILPEDMLVLDEEEPEITLDDRQIREILSGMQWGVEEYDSLHKALSSYVEEISHSMVTVTGVVSNVDWFNESYESKGATSGVVFYDNGRELLILVDRTMIENAETLTVTFFDGQEVPAVVKQYDSNTNLAVLAVQISDLDSERREKIEVASLGASVSRKLPGTPVVVLGSPMGTESLCYGNITSSNTVIYLPDANYKLLQTDIFGSRNASGVIFNLHGQVLGIVTNGKMPEDMSNLITAYGISELKNLLANLANGEELAYMGVLGTNVTEEARRELGVPKGAYIKEIFMDSPAMLGGIQRGDVIVKMNDIYIQRFQDFTGMMRELKPGDTVKVTVKRQAQGRYKEMVFEIVLSSETEQQQE